MKQFFKFFFAALLALVVFVFIGVLIVIGIATASVSKDKPNLGDNGILVIDVAKTYNETPTNNPFAALSSLSKYFNDQESDLPSLHELTLLIQNAKSDAKIKGILLKTQDNGNGFASSEEIRNAILDFKRSKKFVLAYGDAMTEKSYWIASAADKIYVNPMGGIEWKGMSTSIMFYKGLLDKLDIKPEIFYAGKFKSATEPLRETQMTAANKIQTQAFLQDIHNAYLDDISNARHIDTARLNQLANAYAIRTASDALNYGLVDGMKYNDELRKILAEKSGNSSEKLNFISPQDYKEASTLNNTGKSEIRVIYANGDIVDNGSDPTKNIYPAAFANAIREAREDAGVKAIVLRVNSPGGSGMASDKIWREIHLARQEMPVVVSMGNYAASGGYYISSNASYIFAEPNTLTGSIGVFSFMINPSQFLQNKLGVTFDGVKTNTYADFPNATRPMTASEKLLMQNSIDTFYHTFLARVAIGRKKSVADVDAIAQGRVWTGKEAVKIGLVDSLGSLDDAIRYAAHLANTNSYFISEYPNSQNPLMQILNQSNDKTIASKALKTTIGVENVAILERMQSLYQMSNSIQARLPFDLNFE